MPPITDPLTALNLALIASFALGLLFTSGRRRLRVEGTAAAPDSNRRD